MITAFSEGSFAARVDGFPANLTVEVGVRLLDDHGGTVTPRSNYGVTEDPAGSGSYITTLVAPNQPGSYTVFWDWDNGGPLIPSHTAVEDLDVRAAELTVTLEPPLPSAAVAAIPHLAFPLRYRDGKVAVNEQDSYEDVRDCVAAIASFTIGSRIEMLDFGIPEQAFRERGADPVAVRAAVERWEPRAVATAETDNKDLYLLISRLNLELKETPRG